jgi:hypothetical protein
MESVHYSQEATMRTHTSEAAGTHVRLSPPKLSLDKRLSTHFWALLLILIGGIWLVPVGRLPDGTLLIGIGVILLGLNAVRLLNRIPIRVLPTILGGLALVAGLAAGVGAELPLIPLALMAIGASILFELTPRRSA